MGGKVLKILSWFPSNTLSRGLFRILSNIEDGVFCENSDFKPLIFFHHRPLLSFGSVLNTHLLSSVAKAIFFHELWKRGEIPLDLPKLCLKGNSMEMQCSEIQFAFIVILLRESLMEKSNRKFLTTQLRWK